MTQTEIAQSAHSPRKISWHLNQAMGELATLCERIDNGEEITDLMQETFAMLREEAARYSDHAIAMDMALDSAIDQAANMKRYFGERKKMLESIKAQLREGVLQTADEHKDQIAIRGQLGSLQVRKKAASAVYLCTLESRNVTSVLTEDTIAEFVIPEKYIKTVTFRRLDKKAVLEDLKADKELSFAELDTDSKTLSIRKA